VSALVLGATSMVGSHWIERGSEARDVLAVGRSNPRARSLDSIEFRRLDLGDEASVRAVLREVEPEVWLNFAARTDVDGCERERPAAAPPGADPGRSSAWTLNAELPRWIAEEAHARQRYLVHVSTDFVFDGGAGPYAESADPSPWGPRIGWYGYTKGIGERAVRGAHPTAAVLRIAYPFRAHFAAKPDFARTLIERRRARALYPLYTDQRITPTWIPDVTLSVDALIRRRATGTFHVASPQVTTPLEFARALFQAVDAKGGTGDELPVGRLADVSPSAGRAPRPLLGGLRVERIRRLGVQPLDYRSAVRAFAAELGSGDASFRG
jgi:dTDP-4-dehydrorhamnose reductase